MDAEPLSNDICTDLRIERFIEPFSSLPMIRISGCIDDSCIDSTATVRIYYNGVEAIRCRLQATSRGYIFGTQLPLEAGVQNLEVALICGEQKRLLFAGPVSSITAKPTAKPEPGLLSKVVKLAFSRRLFSIPQWRGRLNRFSEKMLVLRQKLRNKFLLRHFRRRSPHDGYVANNALTPSRRQRMANDLSGFHYKPVFSIVMPVYNVEPMWLLAAIASVRNQIYPHWELCIADDRSTLPGLIRALDRLPPDPRIKLTRRDTNGHICAASNSAAHSATGDFIALLDHDDLLAPHALYTVARRLQDEPESDLIYSDEDKIDADDDRYDPQYKPDWSPELLLSYNYINHFTVIRRSLFERAGGFRLGYEGSQDHDLLLRVTEMTDRVSHVPEILYHWRSLPESTASAAGVKGYVHTSGKRAVIDALARRKIRDATAYVPEFAARLGLPILTLDGPDHGPSVAVIIRGDVGAAKRTLEAVRRTTDYQDYNDYLLIDAAEPAEAANRLAAGRSEGYILFLEAGLEPADRRWLSRLMVYARLGGVGAVGGVVRDASGMMLDAGPVLGMCDGIAPAAACAGLSPPQISYYFYAESTRNTAAANGRCFVTSRPLFERLGGFDSRRYPHALWDVDYGIRVRGLGHRCVTVGGVEFVQKQSSRTEYASPFRAGDSPSELVALKRAYGRLLDPYHNPNCGEHEPWQPTALNMRRCMSVGHALRTLIAAHNLNNPEGAPRYLSEIVLGLAERRRIDPIVYSPSGGAGEGVYRAAAIPVLVRSNLESRRFLDGQWSPSEYESSLIAARALLRETAPDVVIANTLMTFPLVEAAARAGIPVVWIIHESYSREHLHRIFPPYAVARIEQAFRTATVVVPASHDTAALFAHFNLRSNFQVIHNGLDRKSMDEYLRRVNVEDARCRLGARPGRKRIIAVGTVCERKGQHALVEAAALLAARRNDFDCFIVGAREGIPYRDYIAQLIARLGLEECVHLVPETDDIWAYYRSADLFVCTSHMETFSRAVLEAEAFGLPIITTPVCGIREQVYPGHNAILFPVGDSRALARHLESLLNDEGLQNAMSKQSRHAFDNHLDEGEMLDRYEAIVLSAAGYAELSTAIPNRVSTRAA